MERGAIKAKAADKSETGCGASSEVATPGPKSKRERERNYQPVLLVSVIEITSNHFSGQVGRVRCKTGAFYAIVKNESINLNINKCTKRKKSQ